MIRDIIVHLLILVFFWALQGLVYNQMLLLEGLIFPMPYVFALIILPFQLPKWSLMSIGLVYGLALDSFTNTLGMHASACVWLTFLMPYVAGSFASKEQFGVADKPTIYSRGLSWYLYYSLVLIVLHHAWIILIEWFKWDHLGWISLRILLSALLSWSIALMFQYIFIAKPKGTH